jgi:hypothetical protein
MSESGVFHSISKFVFPDEKGGIKNGLLLVHTVENFDEAKKATSLRKPARPAWPGQGKNSANRSKQFRTIVMKAVTKHQLIISELP